MKLPVAAKIGIGAALVCAALFLAEAFENPLLAAPEVAVFLCSAWILQRGKAWGGYGPALIIAAVMAGAGLRAEGRVLAIAAGVALVAGALLFRAGRSLPEPGSRWPWIATATGAAAFLAVFQPFVIPTAAMENTILSGDHLLVNRMATEPGRGSLVVHRYPVDRRQTFVKRVVGMPGDRIHLENKKLFVNGVMTPEPYALHKTEYVDPYRDNFPAGQAQFTPIGKGVEMLSRNVVNGEVVVPPGKYFVLGDNRDSSLDSRYWGFVDASDIAGRPVLVYHSVEPGSKARWSRAFTWL